MSLYKLEDILKTNIFEDLPQEVQYHYRYQTKESKGDIPFPLEGSTSFKRHIVNITNFMPAGMKRISFNKIFNVKEHECSFTKFIIPVQLKFNSKGNHIRYMFGTLYICNDNFGYAVLRGYTGYSQGTMVNLFYAFGCMKHTFQTVQTSSELDMWARMCSNCGFIEQFPKQD